MYTKSAGESNPSSPGVGSSGQGNGGPTPPGGQGPDPNPVTVSGHHSDDNYDDWDVGSAADSDDFVTHDNETSTIYIGTEKDGFISKHARECMKKLRNRVDSLNKAK